MAGVGRSGGAGAGAGPVGRIEFEPNPKGFLIGEGMRAKLYELGLWAETNEQFGDFGPAGKRSMLWTNVPGRVLVAFISEDGTAEIKELQEIQGG